MDNYREILNVPPDASVEDIKHSFRLLAKRFHPDSVSGRPDPERFNAAHRAYRALLKWNADRSEENKRTPVHQEPPAWRVAGIKDTDRDVVYQLDLSVAALRGGIRFSLPYAAEDACPRCLGAGHTLAPIFGGPHLVKVDCPRCGKTGVVKHDSHLVVDLTPQVIREGGIRLEGHGHYSPKAGDRGALIVEITPESYARRLRGQVE